ncbi:MAG: hypothetical protein FRX49_08408 [Trebouxia sp. A1-2]|nr:MAG: hypothetical protein FRX49_08408 [Trebouxia sp. A1-2]
MSTFTGTGKKLPAMRGHPQTAPALPAVHYWGGLDCAPGPLETAPESCPPALAEQQAALGAEQHLLTERSKLHEALLEMLDNPHLCLPLPMQGVAVPPSSACPQLNGVAGMAHYSLQKKEMEGHQGQTFQLLM